MWGRLGSEGENNSGREMGRKVGREVAREVEGSGMGSGKGRRKDIEEGNGRGFEGVVS